MKFKFLFLLVTISNSFFAQDKIEITGQIKDAKTKTILEFCSVVAFNPKDSLIAGCATDDKGYFTLPLDRGVYYLLVNYIGYKKDTVKALYAYENKFIGVIKLDPDSAFLKEATVKASSSMNLLDRDVQVVTDKMKVGTSNAKEVLEKVNGVTYDRYNNSIKVDNSSKVIILVDGMEKDQEYIKNLAPDRLKRIEVIRDPGGRYGLEGYSAVINIILKKDYRGTEIYISDENLDDTKPIKSNYFLVQNNFNLTLNYVYNDVNIYGSYSNDYNNFNINSISKKEYSSSLTIENNAQSSNDVNTHLKQHYNNYMLGADYYLNPKSTISFESNLSLQPLNTNTTSQLFNVVNSFNGVAFQDYNSQTSATTNNLNSTNRLFFISKPDENNEINANFSYSFYNNKYTTDYADDLLFSSNQNGTDKMNSTKFYLEYTHTFKNRSNLQLGYGNTWQQQNNAFTSENVSSLFTYSEIREKLYAYYSMLLSKKFSIKFGAAGEMSSPDANGIKNTYFIAEPYLDFKFVPSELMDFKLKYRAQDNYPSIDQTNPFTTFIDKQSEKTGNPFLKPEVINKVSMQIDFLSGLIAFEPYYHFSNNLITQTGALNSDSIFDYTSSNAGNYYKYGLEGRIGVPIGKSFLLETNFDTYKNGITYQGNKNEFQYWTMSSQLIYQNEKSGTVAGVKYQKNIDKNITAQGYGSDNSDYWIVFLQQPFFKQKLSVMLLYFMPINFGVSYNQQEYINTLNYQETKMTDLSLIKRLAMIQINYRFTKGKSAKTTEKKVEEDNQKSKKGIL